MKNLLAITGLFLWSFGLLAQNQVPCSPEVYNQFNFWVGDWDVYDTKGDTIVGHNTIKKILGNCVVEENWTGGSGFKGKSFNTYNRRDSTWNQVWVDMAGSTYHFSGKLKGNVMQFYGETIGQKGNKIKFDMSYTYDKEQGTVRQVWKMSNDEGKTWNTAFDGIYRRKKSKKS